MAEQKQVILNLLDEVDQNGIQRMRNIDESVNANFYHRVLYLAFDDKLRIIYAQIIKRLKNIQLRDKDAETLLMERDYGLIEILFTKHTAKISGLAKTNIIKSNKYGKYDQAYFEEIVIDYELEARAAQDYRIRFLKTKEHINTVV